MLEHQLRRHSAAVELLRQASSARPNCAEYSGKLGVALASAGRNQEALEALDRAVELDAGLAEAHYNRGVVLDRLGKSDEAMAAWRRMLELRPGYDDALNLLGQNCWRGMRPRRPLSTCARRRGVKVVVECQPQLRELLATVEGAAEVVARGEPLPRFDAHVRLISLPGMLGARLGNIPADVPYLRADERRTAEWKRRLEALDERDEHVPPPGVPPRGGGDSSGIVPKDPHRPHPIPLLFEPEPQSRRPEYRARGPDTGEARSTIRHFPRNWLGRQNWRRLFRFPLDHVTVQSIFCHSCRTAEGKGGGLAPWR